MKSKHDNEHESCILTTDTSKAIHVYKRWKYYCNDKSLHSLTGEDNTITCTCFMWQPKCLIIETTTISSPLVSCHKKAIISKYVVNIYIIELINYNIWCTINCYNIPNIISQCWNDTTILCMLNESKIKIIIRNIYIILNSSLLSKWFCFRKKVEYQ